MKAVRWVLDLPRSRRDYFLRGAAAISGLIAGIAIQGIGFCIGWILGQLFWH
jgi:hypothetical protein